jgi:DNA-binding protein HU-beta
MACISLIDIARECTEGLEMSKKTAEELARRILNVAQCHLLSDDEVTLQGIGKLKVSKIPARSYRDPSTGGRIEKAASRKVVFSRTRGENEIK